MRVEAAKILQRRVPYLVTGKIRVTEWTFEVPLSYEKPGENIRLFGRSAEKAESPTSLPKPQDEHKPWRT